MLLQLTGVLENSFKVDWSFDPKDEPNIRGFKVRWCESPSCAQMVRRRRFVRQAETSQWVERFRPPNSRRSFTLTVHNEPVYAFQIIAIAISDEVPVPSLSVDPQGETENDFDFSRTACMTDIFGDISLLPDNKSWGRERGKSSTYEELISKTSYIHSYMLLIWRSGHSKEANFQYKVYCKRKMLILIEIWNRRYQKNSNSTIARTAF